MHFIGSGLKSCELFKLETLFKRIIKNEIIKQSVSRHSGGFIKADITEDSCSLFEFLCHPFNNKLRG